MSKIANRELASVVVAKIAAGQSKAKVAKSLAGFLVSEQRSKDLDAILRLVEQQLRKQVGQLEIEVTSARTVSDSLKKDIIRMFQAESKAKSVIVNEVIDPYVIGGVLVESPDQRLDLTVRRQLQRLKEMGA